VGDTTSVTDPKDNVTSNVYDADRRLINTTSPGHPQRRARALFGYFDDALYRDLLAAN
jgi:YD repeat-containing protein